MATKVDIPPAKKKDKETSTLHFTPSKLETEAVDTTRLPVIEVVNKPVNDDLHCRETYVTFNC